MFIDALLITAKRLKLPKCLSVEQTNKLWYIQTMGYLFSTEKIASYEKDMQETLFIILGFDSDYFKWF